MQGRLYIIVALLAIAPVSGVWGHVKNALLPEGCGSCHVGHGVSNEPMLAASEEEFCYQCHGSSDDRSAMKTAGRLAENADPLDIEQEFAKQYHHPVVEGFGHSPTEVLPDLNGRTSRHAECVDCHNPHQRITTAENKIHEVSGYSLSGQYLETSVNEYEICFKCHVDNTAIGDIEGNAFRDFAPDYVSQHPVSRPASLTHKAPSLTMSLSARNTMKCSDCHTSDDPNGPRGPHGSNYRFLLSGNYDIGINTDESPFAYEFCYSCHDRSSILGDESFPLHRQHIIGDPIRGINGTSCYTCHASHSSKTSEHLIDFNREAVSAVPVTGRLSYSTLGSQGGECYLTCHGHVHNSGRYSR